MWQSKRLLLERAGALEACVAAKARNDFDCHVHLRVVRDGGLGVVKGL